MLFLPVLFVALGPGFLIQDRLVPPEYVNGSAASLVDAELAFAKQADTENTRAAFLTVLDAEGVLFRPGPVNGKAWLTPRKADASKLSWYPAFVEVSRSGDLGYSTGPYEWRAEAGSKEVSHGHFVSIWRRTDGTWKLLLDTGVSHAAPPAEIPVFKPKSVSGNVKSAPAGPTSGDDLSRRERSFAQVAGKHGVAAAYRRFAAADLRLYRDGAFPLPTSRDALEVFKSTKGAPTWTLFGSGVSKSGDLGYAYGFTEQADGQAAKPDRNEKSVFLHLWKRAQTGGWKLVLDLESPLPPEKPHS